MPKLIKSIAPLLPEVRCPGCQNLMRIRLIETKTESAVDLTYRCQQCDFEITQTIEARRPPPLA